MVTFQAHRGDREIHASTSIVADPRGRRRSNEPEQDRSLLPPSPPAVPSTQVSSSTSVALRTETSLSWNHLTDTSVILQDDFFTIALKGTKHNFTHTHKDNAPTLSSATSAVFLFVFVLLGVTTVM